MRHTLVAIMVGAAAARGLAAQCPDGTPAPCPVSWRPPAFSVAVLNFENLTRDTGDAYLSDGLAEELTSRLAQVARLTVASRAAVRRLRNVSDMPVPQIGRALNVAYLVQGTLRRFGDRLRITAELLRVQTGAIAWSSQYDQSRQDLLAIQEAVGTSVAGGVVGRLLPAERTTLAARPTRSPAAYDEYLRGRVMYLRAGSNRDNNEAIAHFQRAIALDSGFARAWAGLSIMHTLLFWSYADRSDERLARARESAAQAAALAPSDPATHLAQGYYHYWGSRDYGRALTEFAAALVANSNDAEVHAAMANVARRQGNWEQSLASRSRAIALDSGNAGEISERGLTLRVLRRFDEAERDMHRAIAADRLRFANYGELAALLIARDGALPRTGLPDSVAAHVDDVLDLLNLGGWLPLWRSSGVIEAAILHAHPDSTPTGRAAYLIAVEQVLLAQGRREDAAAVADSLRVFAERLLAGRPDDDGFHAILGYAWLGLGRCDEALRESRRAAELLPVSKDAFSGPQRIQEQAEIELACGRPDEALEHLAYLLSIPSMVTPGSLRFDPVWTPLRGNARFQQLVSGN